MCEWVVVIGIVDMYVRLVGVGVIMLDGKVICDEIFGDFK